MLGTLIHAYLRTATSPLRWLSFQATEHRRNCLDHTEGYFICEPSSGSLVKMMSKEGLEAHNMRDQPLYKVVCISSELFHREFVTLYCAVPCTENTGLHTCYSISSAYKFHVIMRC
jgi:hypothetical protein